jgi:hypothetical protein
MTYDLGTEIITRKGHKVAVVPYARYKRMQEELEDHGCLKALRRAQADPHNRKNGRPFLEFAPQRGGLK